MVFDTDVAFLTGQGLESTRRDLVDLGADLLIIEETGDSIWVVAKVT
jgi:hypothetical protein